MSFEAEQALKPELMPGERLVWSGGPRQGIRFRSTDLFLVPFGLLWAGFAVYWEWSVVRTGAPLFFVLWGVPFVLAGLYITVGRFLVDSYQRSRTFYGLTERRILILSASGGRRVRSMELHDLRDIEFVEEGEGRGTVTFGPTSPLMARMAGMPWPGIARVLPPGFDQIDDVRKVYDQIRQARAKLAAAPT